MSSAPFDGNASAGSMSDVFSFDVTMAQTTCAFCGDTRPVAELHAYLRAPGTILRCVTCGNVQVRLVRSEGRGWLDLRGVRVLQLPIASA